MIIKEIQALPPILDCESPASFGKIGAGSCVWTWIIANYTQRWVGEHKE